MNDKIEKSKKKTTSRKYVEAVAWFSILWGTKVFILEPFYKNIKSNGKKQ